jgi:predicted RNase H-like HicB family nuclease
VHQDAGSAWGLTFPDLPGCITAADRFEDLLLVAQEAIAGWLEVDADSGHPAPVPSNIDRIRAHPDAKGAISFLPVPAPASDHCIRLNITMPESLVQRIDARVGARERSGFLAQAARRALA